MRWLRAESPSPIRLQIDVRTGAVRGCRVRPFFVLIVADEHNPHD